MQKLFGSQYDDSAPSSGARALEMIDALYNLEMRANILALRQERRKARLQRSIAQWVEYWPVCAGILLSMVAPQMREFVEPFRPWGLWVSFPIVALSIRPEIYLGSHISAVLPAALTYLQFPLEGLLAKIALKGHVTVHGVVVQVVFFHGLCIMDLWLLNGGLYQLMHLFGH